VRNSLVMSAGKRTQKNLGVRGKLEGETISKLLLRYLEDEVLGRLEPVDLEALKRKASEPSGAETLRRQIVDTLLREQDRVLKAAPENVDLATALSDREYLARISEVVVERLRCGPDAPILIIEPKRLNAEEARRMLSEGVNFGLIFGAESIYFQEVVLAFQVDEACSRPPQGRRVNVLGVHVDWLTDRGEATRGLLVDESWRVREVGFEEAVPLHVIQTLHLPASREAALHRRLSDTFREAGVVQVNPYEASERADDKAWTHRLWLQYGNGLESPAFTLIPRASNLGDALKLLEAFIEGLSLRKGRRTLGIFIQPNRGTEGWMVERFEFDPYWRKIGREHPAAKHIDAVLQLDDALVREERGNVRFSPSKESGETNTFRHVSLRINVAWDGSHFVAESGYAQVSRDSESPVASRGRGGEIIDLHEALENLYYPSDRGWVRLNVTSGEIEKIKRTAEAAAQALNIGLSDKASLKMAGIDVVLEVSDSEGGEVLPVLLEANPRPAGLNHSTSLEEVTNDKPKLMVSSAIFRAIRLMTQTYFTRRKNTVLETD